MHSKKKTVFTKLCNTPRTISDDKCLEDGGCEKYMDTNFRNFFLWAYPSQSSLYFDVMHCTLTPSLKYQLCSHGSWLVVPLYFCKFIYGDIYSAVSRDNFGTLVSGQFVTIFYENSLGGSLHSPEPAFLMVSRSQGLQGEYFILWDHIMTDVTMI